MLAPTFNRDTDLQQVTAERLEVSAIPTGGVFRQRVHGRDRLVEAGQARIAEATHETVMHGRLLANVAGQ